MIKEISLLFAFDKRRRNNNHYSFSWTYGSAAYSPPPSLQRFIRIPVLLRNINYLP